MNSKEITTHESTSFLLPRAVEELGEEAGFAFVDFFTAQIRNPNTRAAYGRNIAAFLGWIDEQQVSLRAVQPYHVAAYIEQLARPAEEGGLGAAVSTVKQHLASIRKLCDFLVIRQVLPRNPSNEVRGPRQVVRTGKTPILTGPEARELLESIDVSKPAGLRDRALIATMLYTFGRISAVLGMDITDYYQVGRTMRLRLNEKGDVSHEMPAHHSLMEYMDAHLAELGDTEGPIFRTINRSRTGFTGNRLDRSEAWRMVRRRTKKAGLGERFGNHTFRGTGITAYLKNEGALEQAQYMAAHASISTTRIYDRREQEATLDEVERIIL